MADLVGQAAIYVSYTNEVTLRRGQVDSKHRHIWYDRSIVWRFVRALTFAVQPYYLLQLQYSVAAVSTCLSQPADCPRVASRLRATLGSYIRPPLLGDLLAPETAANVQSLDDGFP